MVATLAAIAAGFLSLPGALRALPRAGAGPPVSGSGDDDLPPPVVGLRSLGGSFRFDPVGLRLEVGDALTWLNVGDFHTVTAFHPANADLLDGDVARRIPAEADAFHSGMLGLDAGSRFDHRFDVPGVYDYFCQPHYSFGMVGRLVVGGRETAEPVPSEGLPEAVRGNLPPVEAIFGPRGSAWAWAARVNGILLLRTEGGSAAEAAAAVREAVLGEARASLPEEAGEPELERRLDRLVEAAAAPDYERLVVVADAVKEALGAGEAGAAGSGFGR